MQLTKRNIENTWRSVLVAMLIVVPSLMGWGGATVRGQEDPDAVHAAMAILISRHSTAADTIAKEISARFSKSAEMQTALARAYFRNNERQQTRHYLNKAIEADPDYPLSYLLYGDLYGEWQVDSACYWYAKAIEHRPTNPTGYLKWAQVMATKDMNKALGMMEQLRRAIPDYSVDVEIAGLYDKKGDSKNAAAAMENVDVELISMNQTALYMQNLYWANNDTRCLEVGQVAMRRFPQNKGFNRVYAWSATRSGMWKEAEQNIGMWLAVAPRDSINSIDYLTHATALMGLGYYEAAFEQLDIMNRLKDDYFLPQMPAQVAQAVNSNVDQLKIDGQYEQAADLYSRYLVAYPEQARQPYHQYQLAQIYRAWQEELNGQEKLDVISRMFKVYDVIEQQWPEWENIHYVLYTHARWTYAYFDAENEQSMALPLYQKLYDVLAKQGFSDDQRKTMGVEACQYMASDAYFQKNDLNTARIWWHRILELDPDNQVAKDALSQIKK